MSIQPSPARQIAAPRSPAGRVTVILCLLIVLFYLLFTIGALSTRGLFDYAAMDYRPFRCAAEIAWSAGFVSVYDNAAQEQCQHALYDAYTREPLRAPYATMPVLYLPVFLLPFLALLPLPAVPSLVAWTVLNAAALGLYLWRLVRAGGEPGQGPSAVALAVAFPAFATLFFGQVNVLLLICLGEFLLANRAGREFRSGIWLAGFLIKPQVPLLLVAGLLVGRRWKALAGLAAGGLALLTLSLLVAGGDGLVAFGRQLLLYPQDLVTSNPHAMTNWRALAIHLERLLPAGLVWGLAWTGTALTALAALALWIRPASPSSPRFLIAVLGTYAAAGAVTWHMHVHTLLPLAAPLLLLSAAQLLPRAVLPLWSLAPPLLFALLLPVVPGVVHNVIGLAFLGLSLYLLAWSAAALWRPRRPPGEATPTRPEVR